MSSRTKHGAKPADLSSLRSLFADGKAWVGLGVVQARQGDNSHFEQTDGDVLVDVDLSPEGTPVWCRLGGQLGGENIGIWRIPPPGTEVGVIIPDGNPKSDPMIVCTLSSGATPDGLDGDVLMVVNTKKVQIRSTEDDVALDSGDGKQVLLQGGDQPIARKTDPVNCGWLIITPGVPPGSATVVAYAPADTMPPPDNVLYPPPMVVIPMTGAISDGSAKAKCG